jgi:hypothetical protein
MMKTILFAVALASLALAGGCAKGGNGVVPTVTVNGPSGIDASALYPGESNVTFTATTTDPAGAPVTWSLGPATTCTGTPNPCGTIDPTTGVYQAPLAPVSATVTATLTSDSSVTGTLGVTVIPVSVVVTPAGTPTAVIVGKNLVQQFTAIAVPDQAPQTFTWSVLSCNAQNCGSVVLSCVATNSCNANNTDVATYTAPPNTASVVAVQATWNPPTPPNPAPAGQANVTVVPSRLPADTYSFQFSGYDKSNNPVAAAGSFILASNGTIAAGVEDVLTAGTPQRFTISSVQYVPNNSTDNNLGTVTVTLGSGPTNVYTAVLTSSGIMRMIESDGLGTGSGVLQKSATVFNASAQNFVFGFTGVDAAVNGKRVGYVGLLPMDGNGNIAGGLLDANDNGTNVCGAQPCSVNAGSTYTQPNASLPSYWSMTLVTGAGTQSFDFFVAGGGTNSQTSPLTLYAISTDATFPALSGSMAYQWPGTAKTPITYNNVAFCPTAKAGCTSVSNLTGASANVALTVGTTDGTSGGTGGAGGFTGTSDQNDDGTIISIPPAKPFSYTYVATPINTNEYLGRYTFQMLGDPNATTVVPPLTFVLYASGANRGFLLDQSSSAVMTGTMDPQPASAAYTPSELPGTYAAAPVPNSNSTLVTPAVENLLLSSPGGTPPVYSVAGTQNPGSVSLIGTYTVNNNSTGGGTGTISLTSPAATNYVIYAIDGTTIPNPANPKAPNFVITDFMMMGTCTPQAPATTCSSGPPSSIIFAQQ